MRQLLSAIEASKFVRQVWRSLCHSVTHSAVLNYSGFSLNAFMEVLTMTALDDRYLPVRRRSEPWTAQLQTPTLAGVYFVSSIGAFALGSFAIAISLLIACLYANPYIVLTLQRQYSQTLRQMRLSPVMVTGCLIGFLGGAAVFFSIADPAHAQFFTNTEEFLTTLAADAGGDFVGVITIIMNTIRALFLIYMIFGLVQVINAARQGEEWKDLAKTPFLILMIGVLGDVLAGAIIGG
jgi:hypothetical protein